MFFVPIACLFVSVLDRLVCTVIMLDLSSTGECVAGLERVGSGSVMVDKSVRQCVIYVSFVTDNHSM